MLTAEEIIAFLDLMPHPDGGHYRETFRDPRRVGGRSMGVAGYLLLARGEVSRWGLIDTAELWQFYQGAPLELDIAEGDRRRKVVLGSDVGAGARIQAVAPVGCGRSARSRGAWSLIGCTVAPGIDFAPLAS